MEQVINKIEQLRLVELDNAWVDAIYLSEYLEFGEVPAKYDSILKKIKLLPIFRSIMNAVESWLSMESDADEEKSWASLSRQVAYRKLLAVLGYCIYRGTKYVINEPLRSKALVAARVYFKLLSIPGYMAYNIYHSQLFAHSLACVGFPKTICDKYDEQKANPKSKDDQEDKIANIQELKEQVNALIKQLQLFVIDLRAIIAQLQLGPNDMNFEDILNNLVDVTGGAIVNKLNVGKLKLNYITTTYSN